MTTIELPAQVKAKDAEGRYAILSEHPQWTDKGLPKDAVDFQWHPGEGVYDTVWYLELLPGEQQALLCCFEDDTEANDERPHCMRRTIGICSREHLPLITAIAQGVTPETVFSNETHLWQISAQESAPDETLWRTGILRDGGHPERYKLESNQTKPAKKRTADAPLPHIPIPRKKRKKSCAMPLLLLIILSGSIGYNFIQMWQIDKKNESIRLLNDEGAALSKRNQELEEQHKQINNDSARLQELVEENTRLKNKMKKMLRLLEDTEDGADY